MKRTFTFLMTLFLAVGAMWAQVTSLEGFSQDKCYTFATAGRGAWAVDAAGTLFSSTGDQGLTVDANDTKQQFAVLSANGADYYLYSVSAKKFVKADRTLVTGPADALAITDASSQGAGRVQFRFRDVNNSYINLGGSNQMSVDWWGTIDGGNAVLVSEAGDFNAAEALAMLSKSMYVVTYEFVYDGQVRYTQEVEVAEGDVYPAVSKQFPFGISVSESVPEGVVTAAETVQLDLAVALPFEYVDSYDALESNWAWYFLQFHASNKNYLYHDESLNYLDASKTTVDRNNVDAYTWAFVGNPFDGFKVVNRAAGASKALKAAADGAVVADGGHVFTLSASSYATNGFFMASAEGENTERFNKQNGKVVYWSGADAGSTFMVEVRVSPEAELAELVSNATELLEANTTNHAAAPVIGQYSTAGYETLAAALAAEDKTFASVEAAVAAFHKDKNLPLFTINSLKDYALGQSIYENEEGALKFKATDATDKSMLWAFDMTTTEVGLTDKVVVRNAATGNLFWGASFISVIETEPAVEGDGAFMFKTEGTGNPIHAQQSGSSIVRWSSADANAVGGASTWTFAFVGLTNNAAYDLTDLAAPFTEQAMAFAGLQSNMALFSLPAVQEKWAEGMAVVEPLSAAIAAGELTLKADVVAAMNMMAEIQSVVTFYSETFAAVKDEANAAMDELDEESEEFAALLGAINVSTVTTVAELEAKAEIIAEVLEYLASLPEVDPNDYTSYIVNADLSTGDAWNVEGTKGISGGMVKVASESAFDFNQTITLPAGQYKVTAKAAYRYTGGEQEEYDAIQAGTETHLVKLYAETSSYKYEGDVMNRWEGASETNLAGDGVSEVNGKFVPNSSNAVLAWFNAGQYANELVFNVQEEGAVKIGITRVGGIAGDYTNIGAWTLTRLGDAEADPEVEEPEQPEEPGDETEEIVDLDMTHKVSRDWEGKSGNVTIDGIAMSEKYEGNADPVGDQLWQTVTGLENGKYTVKLWANARVAWVGSPAADGQEELTYIFANNVEKSIAVLHNPQTNGNVLRTLEGVEVTDGTLRMGMKKVAAGSNWHSIQIESLTLHATNEVIANIAKVDLKAALDAANAVSPVTDEFAAAIAAAQDVYDNSKDAEEVKAAVASLKEATKLAILMNATEENPVLTDFVVNGTFDAGTTGWKSTTGAQNQGTATNQQGAFTGAFFENWNPNNYIGKLYQVIENIPNGVYELSICAFTNNFDATAQFVYANGDKVALTAGEPTAYTVRTIVKNNTIEVGFEQTAAVSNWCGIDNISLTYLGEASNEEVVNAAKAAFTAAYDEFGVALEACNAMMLKMSFYEIDDAAYQLNGQLATTTDVDALNAMTETLIEAIASLNDINAVYAEYDVFVQKFMAAAEISEPKTTEAAELLEYNMYGGAGMQATSLEALEQAAQTIKEEYFTYIANAKLLDGNMFDLTYLIQNPDFAMNLDGWTGVKANRIGGEGYDGVGGIAEIGEWGASSWNASMSQAITNLPNGKYVVKAAWMAASGIEMTFAANAGEATVTGIGDTGGNIAKDGSVVAMGEGHRGWQYVEVEGLVEDGTLTITVSSSSAAQYQWSNADAFELYYAGVPEVVEPEYLAIVSAVVGEVALVEGTATVQSISTIDVTFDRPVALAENAGWATLEDKWGPTNLDAEVLAENACVVRFTVSAEFNGEFTDAGEYYLNIPEGFIVGAEDANYINAAIEAVITIEAAPATPLTVVNVTVGEDVMEGFTAVATPEDMIKVNFDGQFYFQGTPSIVDAEGNDASEFFMFANGLDVDGSNSYIFMGQKDGIYTITLAKASFMEFMSYKAPAEDIVLTVQIVVEPEMLPIVSAMVGDVEIVEGAATVESISTIDITFDRPVALAENAGWATLADSWGPTNLDAEVLEGQNVVRFSVSAEFNGEFTEAGEYILNIPEGFIVGAEEANYINAEVTATITIEAAPATPLAVTNVTVGEDTMEGLTAVAKPEDMIKVNFDGQFYFQGMPSIVDAEGNDASEYFQFMNGMDYDGSNAYILMAQNWEGTAAPAGIYTITLAKASFMVNQYMPAYKAPAEDIVLTVQITFPDGIENIEAETELVIYDLSGRRVNEMTKGIYIVNGKKVIKK